MIRVSCNALCRIYNAERGFLLALNQNRLSQGKRILMPLGGSLECYVLSDLLQLGVEWEHGADLRLIMDEKHLDAFRRWFLTREGRETSPMRELQEELIDEIGALNWLTMKDVTIAYAFLREDEKPTERSNARIPLTHYFNEIFDVTFTTSVLKKFDSFMKQSDVLQWVTREMIERGYVDENTAVSAVI